jgi:hypothetical protein
LTGHPSTHYLSPMTHEERAALIRKAWIESFLASGDPLARRASFFKAAAPGREDELANAWMEWKQTSTPTEDESIEWIAKWLVENPKDC